MCRLLGVISGVPRPLNELLTDDIDNFLQLACEHGDGWGLGLRSSNGTIETRKDAERADWSPRLQSLLNTSTTDAALLHLRMASSDFAVTRANSHPFGDSTVAFAHNGDFVPSTALNELIGPDKLAAAEGDTDSERFYLRIRQRMDDGVDPADAILQSADEVRTRSERFMSLNCLLLRPDALFVYAEHDPYSEVIGRRGPGYFGIQYRQDADKVVVVSTERLRPEPLWTTLPERHVLQLTPGTLDVTLHRV
ncbi:class II glutamine amidotransferase [Streptomyces sp. NPDC051639]|uniref:class II glutamine amidotransferase n=1 Tax=Streptomyces sp. NPDC051639 TaxID=3155671 RepID=UPI00341A377F